MIRCVAALIIIALPGFSQAGKQARDDENQALQNQRESAVLRDMPPVTIGDGLNDSALDENSFRKAVYDTLSRYKIPVKWTPKPAPHTEAPSLFAIQQVERSDKGSSSTVMTLQLVDLVSLPRKDGNRPILVVVWDAVDGDIFSPRQEKEAMLKLVNRLVEKFCLAYLAANR